MTSFSIVIADDHPAFREGVQMKLEREDGLEVIAEASNGRDALHLTLEHTPDLLLVDMDMPEMSGLEVTKELHLRGCTSKILPLSGHADPEYVIGTLESGAAGYIMKDESLASIVRAIRTVLDGGVFISSRVAQQIVVGRLKGSRAEARKQKAHDTLIHLGITPTLLNVLRLAAVGMNNREIANKISRSEHTVRNQIYHLKELTGAKWRPGLVAWVWKNNILEVSEETFFEGYSRLQNEEEWD